MSERRHFILIHTPGKAPIKKGPWNDAEGVLLRDEALMELLLLHKSSDLTLLTITEFGDVWPSCVEEHMALGPMPKPISRGKGDRMAEVKREVQEIRETAKAEAEAWSKWKGFVGFGGF